MKTKKTTIDLTPSWRYVVVCLLTVIKSHARKTYTDSKADQDVECLLMRLLDQHEQLSGFYVRNSGKVGAE